MNDLSAGDVVLVDLGIPLGSGARFESQAIVVSASSLLRRNLATLFIVPCTTRQRRVASHVGLQPDATNGLAAMTWAQCEHLRSIERSRCIERLGNTGTTAIEQIREILALLIDIR